MLRRTALLLALLGLLVTVLATGGFSAASADRPVNVAVAPDDRAFLGVDVETDTVDRRAVSFVGFCTPSDATLSPAATVTRYKPEVDWSNANREALAVAWETADPVSTVVVKTGSPAGQRGGGTTAIQTFPGGQSGTVTVGDGTETTSLTPSDYCPEGEHEAAKVESESLDVAPDATAVGGITVTVVNRFPERLETVTVTAGGATRTVENLASGESATVTLPVDDCERVAIDADGESVGAELTRDCP